MRLSAIIESPHYDRERALVTHVFCDGIFVPLCVEFDSDEGWADVYALDRDDKIIIENKKAKVERLHGKITYRDHTEGINGDTVQADRGRREEA